MTSQDISSTVQGSLEGSIYSCISLEKLSGGTANYVFRGVLAKPLEEDGSKTVVIKHTPPYVAAHPDFKLTATRCVSHQLTPFYLCGGILSELLHEVVFSILCIQDISSRSMILTWLISF